MVINRRDIKRKRKDNNTTCSLLDESPKRTKVHAQRKFAQGSNVSSPVITPVKEIEKQEKLKPDVLPEPQELLPMNRPNTEDFLTFLCFRGTSMLPPNLNFFNAVPVDSRVHTQPLKKEPIDVCPPLASISTRTTPGTSERPFIAFGVRKRADPVLVSKHMDKKRRHALALQALRRKYQEQKMAKIRAVTISKLSEKITNKTLVRTRSVTKNETTPTKKNLQPKARVKIVATKRVKVATRRPIKAPIRAALTAPIRSQIQKRMCLRSFRGRFIQQELAMKKSKKKPAKMIKKPQEAKGDGKKKKETSSEFSSDDDQPLVKTVKVIKPSNKVPLPKIAKKCSSSKKPKEISFRVTRAHPLLANREQTVKRKIQITRSALQLKSPFVKLTPPKKLSPKQKPKPKEEKEKSPRIPKTEKTGMKEDSSISSRTRKAKEELSKKEPTKKPERELRRNAEKPEVVEKDLRKKPEKDAAVKDSKKEADIPVDKDTKKKIERDTPVKIVKKESNTPIEKDTKKAIDKDALAKELKKEVNPPTEKDTRKKDAFVKDLKKEVDTPTKKDTKKKIDKLEATEKDTKAKCDKPAILEKDHKKKMETLSVPEKDAKKKPEKVEATVEPNLKNKLDKSETSKKKPEAALKKEIEKKPDKLEIISENPKKKLEKPKVPTEKDPKTKPNKPEVSAEKGPKKKVDKAEEASVEKEVKKKPEKPDAPVEKDAKKKGETLAEKEDLKAKLEKPEGAPAGKEALSEKEVKKPEPDTDKDGKRRSETITEKEVKKKPDKPQPEKDSKKKIEKQEVPVVVEEPRVSQRPSRKTKEAAAIYMEILGHKLVSEGDMDDDSISIDSFPELPNVRKTEQREIELKARVICKNVENSIEATLTKPKIEDKILPKAKAKKVDKPENAPNEDSKKPKADDKVANETVKNVDIDLNAESKAVEKQLKWDPAKAKKSDIFSDSDSSAKKSKSLKKPLETPKPQAVEAPKKPVSLAKPEAAAGIKRSTRGATIHSKSMIDISFSDSEDSFMDEPITINKERKKIVHPKRPALAKSASSSAIPAKSGNKTRAYGPEESESVSDESTTSKMSKTYSKMTSRNKKIKLSKGPVATPKLDNSFSDSDEEPLSKLTLVKPKHEENKDKIVSAENAPEGNPKAVLKRKSVEGPTVNDPKKSTGDSKPPAKKECPSKPNKQQNQQKPDEQPVLSSAGKPKRECTKRLQNYLPLFSSSEDEEKYFHGFIKSESAKQAKSTKSQESKCHPTPSADLLCKDVDKRFGKGKVNMSTEQIEKWLKESAMAGSVIKKENDDILKYEVKPQTEIALINNIDLPKKEEDSKEPEKIKESPEKIEVKIEPPTKPEVVAATTPPKSFDPEKVAPNPQASSKLSERKMIFRKERKLPTPSVNAFSPNNESSVYAFEAENEDAISTPFRRPTRRPSSTATSRSEDSSKYDESSKAAGKFRLPSAVNPVKNTNTNKQEVSVMLSTDDSNNIAVQLDIDSTEVVNTESSAQTDAEDGEQLFYIPLQPGKQSSSQLIQGVAVKLGTKGANGPNQRVVMSAKLVTHTPAGAQKLIEKPLATSTPMYPPAMTVQKPKSAESKSYVKGGFAGKACDRMSDNSEDCKYKVPSSPSASSSSSTKVTKRQYIKSRIRPLEFCNPINASEFPSSHSPAVILEAPIFHPNEKEFQDPLEYIEKIRSRAEKFGICRIVPPSNFKPDCKVADDMRFTAYNQYVHKMLHRWGPNFKELMAITKYLETQNIALTHPPWIGCMEIDLPRLYQIVQSLGGLKEVIEKKKWPKVSEMMKIPRSAQDRVTKLDDIYCKYLLPYDTLSPAEREKLFDEVETEWAKRESRALLRSQQNVANRDTSPNSSESDSNDEAEECIVKGRNMALNAFYRIARNTMSMWFKTMDPTAQEVEQEFWKHVTVKQNHICVHSGSIDSGSWGYGFAVSKSSPFARHAWNLKVLTNNSGSLLRSMGPVMGVTVPTLHVGMVFSACCWYRDPHSLPWIEYLHTGGNKIWYGIPDSMSEVFHSTLLKLVPNYCRNKSLWLPSDTAMLPPSLLVENGVSLCRTIQEPGQFIVVFPKAFTSSICTGYVVSESVYFAPLTWLSSAQKLFDELQNNCEPSMFSFQKLLISIASDVRSSVDVLKQVIPAVQLLREQEKSGWEKLQQLGLSEMEKLPIPDAPIKKKKRLQNDSSDYECEECCRNLFISWVIESQEDAIYCLDHAMEGIEKKKVEASNCKLVYTYDDKELANLIEKMKNAIEAKLQKKTAGKSTAGPP